ncbi:hypothetical protein E4U21_007190 [Claviceps maximensis]|nr:hypothetical protein E4U21_007190 [Claviceps maximensis]
MEGIEVRVLPCGHRFDRSCVDPWLLKRSATCPLCRDKVTPRLPTLLEKLPKTPRSIYLSATRWKQSRSRSRSTASSRSPSSFATAHAVGRKDSTAIPLAQMGPSLCSVPSVRSGGPGSGWASKTIIVSCPLVLGSGREAKET